MITYVHIGQHKTGTTSFQATLARKRMALLAEGIYVADYLADAFSTNHYYLNVICLAADRYSTKKIEVLDRLSNCDLRGLRSEVESTIRWHYANARRLHCKAMLWSNEGLFLLNSEQELATLKGLFEPYSKEVLPIWVRREQSGFLQSYARELGGKLNAGNAERLLGTIGGGWLVDYERKAALLNAVFGRFLLVDYEEQDDVVKALLTLVGAGAINSENIRLNRTKI